MTDDETTQDDAKDAAQADPALDPMIDLRTAAEALALCLAGDANVYSLRCYARQMQPLLQVILDEDAAETRAITKSICDAIFGREESGQ
jgi:hypothetical protein